MQFAVSEIVQSDSLTSSSTRKTFDMDKDQVSLSNVKRRTEINPIIDQVIQTHSHTLRLDFMAIY